MEKFNIKSRYRLLYYTTYIKYTYNDIYFNIHYLQQQQKTLRKYAFAFDVIGCIYTENVMTYKFQCGFHIHKTSQSFHRITYYVIGLMRKKGAGVVDGAFSCKRGIKGVDYFKKYKEIKEFLCNGMAKMK